MALGHGQFIRGQGEVVHADGLIAGGQERLAGHGQQLKLGVSVGNRAHVDQLLIAAHHGQVGKGVDRHTIGTQSHGLSQGVGERLGLLRGQAVDQVEVDAAKAVPTRTRDQVRGLLAGLPAADGLLNLGREVLHAHGDSVETEARQHVEMGFAGHAGIDFDSQLRLGQEFKVADKAGHQAFELRRRKVGGRAAAQVKLRDLASPGQARGHQIEFAQQVLQVRLGYFPAGGGEGMATAEGAASFAEGQMSVDGQGGGAARVGAFQRAQVVGLLEVLAEFDRGWVGRVARPGTVVAGQHFGRDGAKIAHASPSGEKR